jgi:hypothetical protein
LTEDHIESLEHELFQLKSCQTDPAIDVSIHKEAQLKKVQIVPSHPKNMKAKHAAETTPSKTTDMATRTHG